MAHIIWFIDNRELVVKFTGVGEYKEFSTLLSEFKAIGKPRWSRDEKSWKLPVEDFPKLVRFADRRNISLSWMDARHSLYQQQLL